MINLCAANGPLAEPLEDAEVIRMLKNKIIAAWPVVKNPDNFPGPQPVSMEREYMWKLGKYPYSVCEKTDGMRYFLVATDGICAMVDRAFRFYRVAMKLDPDYERALSILDGELVCDKYDSSWTFYAYDAVVVRNQNCAKDRLDQRLDCISKFVSSVAESPFKIKVKRFWKLRQIEDMLKSLAETPLRHESDGLIFTPSGLPVGTGTQMSLIKWKPSGKHTFDFKVVVKRGPSSTRYDLFSSDRGRTVKHASINERTVSGRIFHQKYREISTAKVAIVECSYSNGNYVPILVRADKTHPNSVRTVEKTHLNIEENICVNDIVELAKK